MIRKLVFLCVIGAAGTTLAAPGSFDARAYHDFLLGQGLLPFDLLEQAVMQQFVPAQRGKH